ncbi:putative signal transduction response regulator, receiver domain protein [Candidatus Nitrososphaera gargensis Ga9.2]|uniref:Putative signal transduction response regulator, receiver domain protein n=1 Tax=Nitrososphaera gargensis (strain Ga9.2) TaxID=1237085 RepID=K0IML6_NITGG|nr:response regulator [Candidatus Nitrososphaera gargensis]AFU57999.1 putative signal transduction response regulator, receiver domain protein [Candidatus Nitrososphaera gargensis Ga9.2]
MGLRQQDKVQTIMLIEDEEDILLVYRDFLERRGYRIEVSAPTANEILRDYEAYQPDLVLLDYRLPGYMNGLQAAEKILQKDPMARILIVTAYEDAKKELAENKFFNGKKISILIKPVQLGQLARLIARL